jgi:hypothetical protein
MLAADMARFGGANQDLIWQGFAMRGFGQFQNTVSNADTNPVPDFSSPMASNATASVRSASSSHCFNRSRRISLWFTSARNSSDGNRTSRGLRRVNRWISTGIAAAPSPKRNSGLRKFIAPAPARPVRHRPRARCR